MNNEWKQILEESLKGMRFGSVEIVIHEGKITQIERRERFRAYRETDGTRTNPRTDSDRLGGGFHQGEKP